MVNFHPVMRGIMLRLDDIKYSQKLIRERESPQVLERYSLSFYVPKQERKEEEKNGIIKDSSINYLTREAKDRMIDR